MSSTLKSQLVCSLSGTSDTSRTGVRSCAKENNRLQIRRLRWRPGTTDGSRLGGVSSDTLDGRFAATAPEGAPRASSRWVGVPTVLGAGPARQAEGSRFFEPPLRAEPMAHRRATASQTGGPPRTAGIGAFRAQGGANGSPRRTHGVKPRAPGLNLVPLRGDLSRGIETRRSDRGRYVPRERPFMSPMTRL
jgi:hypothetical protein